VTAESSPVPLAGRQSRSSRTRDTVLSAFLALIEEGDISPTAERVAQRSGVSPRTVYHQFADLATLHQLAGERLFARVQQIPSGLDLALPLNQRIDAFVRYRVNVYDLLHPLSSAARIREPHSPALRANRDGMLRYGEQNVRESFAPELDLLPEAQARRLVAAISLATNWSAWYALLEELQQERSEAIALMRATTRTFLAQPEQFR
jgi:TetR/AcrR family transcriptional regulator of autoinduction and epiphytic fitness